MAKLTDKFFNRVIEGPLEVDSSDGNSIVSSLVGKDIKVKKLEATSDAKVGGKLQVTGNAEVYENIVDKDGHKRFIEGEIGVGEYFAETVEKVYGKWSLSGSHLLIVFCGSVANGETLTSQKKIMTFDSMPQWIKDKIYPVVSTIVGTATATMWSNTFTTQVLKLNIVKDTYGGFYINVGENVTLTDDRSFRYQLDLLIDNESAE